MKNYLIIFTVMSFSAVLGCDNRLVSKTKSSESKPVAPAPINPAPLPVGSKTGEESKGALSLQGVWDSGCDSEGFQGEMSQRVVHKITGSELLTTTQLFSDAACDAVSTTFKNSATIKVGSASKSVVGGYDVDIAYVSVQVTLSSEASLQSFKADSLEDPNPKCRALADTLKVNTPADILPCLISSQDFTLMQVVDNKLRFGDCDTEGDFCKTAATRAVKLMMGRGFVRQSQ